MPPEANYPLPLTFEPMEAKSGASLPEAGPWQYEPKWDGFRCLAFKAGEMVDLRAKSGKPLTRYFPEVVEMLRGLDAPRFVLDGELVIQLGGTLDFDALQMRLHPAESRIRRLARETPVLFTLFDLPASPPGGAVIVDRPLRHRREALETFMAEAAIPRRLTLSAATRDIAVARGWLAEAGHGADRRGRGQGARRSSISLAAAP